MIPINHGSFFQENYSLWNLPKNKNFVLENWFLMVSAFKELFPKNGNGKVVKILFPEKMIRDLLELHYFLKLDMKR